MAACPKFCWDSCCESYQSLLVSVEISRKIAPRFWPLWIYFSTRILARFMTGLPKHFSCQDFCSPARILARFVTGSRREFGYQKFCFLAGSLLRFLPGIKIQMAKISPGPQCDPTKIPALILQGDVITCTFMLSESIATTHTFINITSYYHLCPVSQVFQECTEYRLNLAVIPL